MRFSVARLRVVAAAAAVGVLGMAGPCLGQEIRVGAGFSGRDLVVQDGSGPEQGSSITAEYLFKPIEALRWVGRPRPYVGVLVSLDGYTNFAQAGLNWRVQHGRFYVDLGGGGAIHDGAISLPGPEEGLPDEVNDARRRARDEGVDFGQRVLFHASLAAGVRLNKHWAIELGAQHWSNGHVHSATNDGSDIASVRVAYRR